MVYKLALVSCFFIISTICSPLNEMFPELEGNIQNFKHESYLWALKIEAKDDENQEEIANDIAKRYGMINGGLIGNLENFYKMEYVGVRRERRTNDIHTQRLADHPNIKWVEQQEIFERTKRSEIHFNDPNYSRQWYLHNENDICKTVNITKNVDHNLMKVWKQGYTGKGIVVSVVDDGLDHQHPDLKNNYDSKASTDLNGGDDDPKPDDSNSYNSHGTKCAGEIAAEANNGICGVGVAYGASIGGVRLLDGSVTDSLEASALGFANDYIDIYSNCWGPKDDGKTFGRPGKLTMAALKKGTETGRKGKGSIYVWATGNGGGANDDCNCDGYTTSIYTISIGAVSCYGLSTFYDEMCSSTLAVTYTSGYHNPEDAFNKMPLVTTDLHNGCTESFQGTSSAAPIAAGIIALVLEANGNLGWRDIQHLIVHTSKKTSPDDYGWHKNGGGFEYNHKFGFGLMDAGALVDLALKWKNVGRHLSLHVEPDRENSKGKIPGGGHVTLKLKTNAEGTTDDGKRFVIKKLEHVVVAVSLTHRRRGDVSISLTSPSGTTSQILSTRHYDDSTKGLVDWHFSTVYCWGEDPKGEWVLTVKDDPDTSLKTLNKKNDIEETERENIEAAIRKAHRKKDFIIQPGRYAYDVRPNEFVRDEIHHGRSKEDYMKGDPVEDENKRVNKEYERREQRDEKWEDELYRKQKAYRRQETKHDNQHPDYIRKMNEAFRKREAIDKRIEEILAQLESGKNNGRYRRDRDDDDADSMVINEERREYASYKDIDNNENNFYFSYYDEMKRSSGTLDDWSITFYGTED